MPTRLLEVIACSVADAVAAQRGGAHRLEIVRDLDVGGLTPPLALVRDIMAAVTIPVRVMVRDNAGFTVSGDEEIESLCKAAGEFAALGVDGIVLGFLQGRELDLPLTQRILRHAPSVHATFHRAFEELAAPEDAIAAFKTVPQIDRILISGPPDHLDRLARIAAPEIRILAGGGVTPELIRTLIASTTIREFHVGRAARLGHDIRQNVDAERVRALVGLIVG